MMMMMMMIVLSSSAIIIITIVLAGSYAALACFPLPSPHTHAQASNPSVGIVFHGDLSTKELSIDGRGRSTVRSKKV
jgi:hypothetical protein